MGICTFDRSYHNYKPANCLEIKRDDGTVLNRPSHPNDWSIWTLNWSQQSLASLQNVVVRSRTLIFPLSSTRQTGHFQPVNRGWHLSFSINWQFSWHFLVLRLKLSDQIALYPCVKTLSALVLGKRNVWDVSYLVSSTLLAAPFPTLTCCTKMTLIVNFWDTRYV